MTVVYVIFAILMFGALIFIHELGHFVSARIFKVPVKEFSIGMGPKLLSKTSEKSGTMYALRLFPIGGFVSMVGEDETSDNEDSLNKKPVWARLIIMASGALMNILLAVVLMSVLVISQDKLPSNTVAGFLEGATSSSYGLTAGDEIIRVDGVRVHTYNDLAYEIMRSGVNPVDLTVVRDGEKIILKDVIFPTSSEKGVVYASSDFMIYAEAKTPLSIIKHSFFRSLSTVKMIWDSLIDMLSGKYGIDAIQGPIGVTGDIANVATEAEKTGTVVPTLLYLTVVISMNLGIFNLLPFPALDGGKILFLIIELIRRKPVNPKYQNYVDFAGIVILLAFMAFVALKDIVQLFV